MEITPSDEQIVIFDHAVKTNRNLVVSAVAGSGKTTTLLELLKRIPSNKTVLFMAFNRAIAQELEKRAPAAPNIEIRTVYAFGNYCLLLDKPERIVNFYKYNNMFKAILNYFETKQLQSIEKYNFGKTEFKSIEKIKKILNECAAQDDEFNIDEFTANVIDICDLGRLYNISKKQAKRLQEHAEHHSVISKCKEIDAALCLIELGVFYNIEFDFTDMIYLPNRLDIIIPTYDYVLIDEVQDLNICQSLIMKKAISNGGKFIAVGDPSQAIYGFSGADHEAFNNIKKMPNTDLLPLSITYRCPTQIIEMVRPLNDQIKTYPSNDKGLIIDKISYNDIQDGDMILCRQTFPIVSLCMKYLSQGKAAYIIGSDIGKSLINAIAKTKRKSEEYIMSNVMARLDLEYEHIVSKQMQLHNLTKPEAQNQTPAVSFKEKIEAIESIAGSLTNPDDVIAKIKTMFSDDNKKGICLSTIHKAKGLENERVFILMQQLMPSKHAKKPWELEQEKNLRYVAYTRAKQTLGFINDYDAFSPGAVNTIERGKISESKHVGKVGDTMYLKLTVFDIKKGEGQYGPYNIYNMKDDDGNIFYKFGNIKIRYMTSPGYTIEVGSKLAFMAIINSHDEYQGIKRNKIGNIL